MSLQKVSLGLCACACMCVCPKVMLKLINYDFCGQFFPFVVDKFNNTAVVQGSHFALKAMEYIWVVGRLKQC